MNKENLQKLQVQSHKIPSNITLVEDQQRALHILEDWMKSKSLFKTLAGYAGTGKTFLIREFIRQVVEVPTIVTAPTHKALRVLESGLGMKGKTLHSLLGLKPNLDLLNFDIERPQFDPLKEPSIKYYRLVIVDECSMVNKGLFTLIAQQAAKYKTKILYCGDALQLPPVGEDISQTFSYIPDPIILRQIVRQEEGHPLFKLFPLIRQDVVKGTNTFLQYISRNPMALEDDNGYIVLNKFEFKQQVTEMLKSDNFSKDIDYCRVLTYTNDGVKDWNSYFRTQLIGDRQPLIHIDDLFTSYNSILDDFNNPIITNSEDYAIDFVKDYITDDGIKTFAVNLKSLYDKKVTPPFLIIDHRDEASLKKYTLLLDILHSKAKDGAKSGWYKYYSFKKRYLTLIDLYLKASRKKVPKDIDYGYSITTHKSQGSTFFNTAIDIKDMVYVGSSWNKKPVEPIMRNKLIYVALSRARNKVIIQY